MIGKTIHQTSIASPPSRSQSPPKGETIPYRPKMMISPVNAPIVFANGQAYQVQGQFAIPLPPNDVSERTD